MRALLYAQINLFALFVMLLILMRILQFRLELQLDHKLFVLLCFSLVLMLVFDSLMWLADGKAGALNLGLNRASSMLYYACNPLPTLLWALYSHYKIFKSEKRLRRLTIVFSVLLGANALLSVWSLFENVYFTIDALNVYHRGPYFFGMVFICYLFYAYTLLLVFANRKSIERKNVLPLLLLPIMPLAAGLAQAKYYGVSIIWPSMTLSLLVVYITMQQEQINRDYLSGLFNRRQFDDYCTKLDQRRHKSKFIAGILIDIDDFKQINDRFGHVAGDQAIIATAELIKRSLRPGMFAARYAGDEFVLFFEAKRADELKELVKRIRKNVKDFNARKSAVYELSLSMGYDVLREDSPMTSAEFFKHLDDTMYAVKRQRKNVQQW